jgi:hypothetical protein
MAKFKKGEGGRPKGIPNKATRDIRALAQALFDAEYWTRTKKQLDAGKLNPAIHVRLLAYAFGEPKKVVRLEGEVSVKDKRAVLEGIPDSVLADIEARTVLSEPDEPETVN